MAEPPNEYFDSVEIYFYELLDPVTKRPGLDIEVEVEPDRYPSVSSIVGAIREALADAGVQDCVVLERRRTEFDWGASGVAETILVGIATTYLADGILSVIQRMVAKHSPGVMSEDAAESHVRQRVAVRYDVDASELELVSVSTNEESVSVTLRHPEGVPTYAVTVVGAGPGARATRIERIEQASAPGLFRS